MQKGLVITTRCGFDLSSLPSPSVKPSGPVGGTKTSTSGRRGPQAPAAQRSRRLQPWQVAAAARAVAVAAGGVAVAAGAFEPAGSGGAGLLASQADRASAKTSQR